NQRITRKRQGGNMTFSQQPPRLGNQYEDDRALRSYLKRTLPPDVLRDVEPSLAELGELAGAKLYRLQLEDRLNEPRLTQWDAWGERVDRIEVSPLWRVAERLAAEHGVVATAYERKHGAYSRLHQCALAYLFTPSTDIYSCPLAMTDGAARTLPRPEGNPSGGRGLALFFVETRDERGRLRNIRVDRLKDKLGTRKVPTAELTLDGTPAELVKGTTDGVRDIAPMLNITRLWNGVSAASLMR